MNTLRVPIPTIDDTSHASNVFGGVTAYWAEEAASITESQASFSRVVMDAKKLTLFANVPNELLADAPAFEGFFNSRFPDALAFFEDLAFIQGSGTGEPLGFLDCPGACPSPPNPGRRPKRSCGRTWSTPGRGCCRPRRSARCGLRTRTHSRSSPPWPCRSVRAAARSGSETTPACPVAPTPHLRRSSAGRCTSQEMPTLGTTGDIILADLSYFLIGDRMAMQLMSSEHYKFQNDRLPTA